ncbi:MAG: glycine cleavage system H protein [Myxococcales bacterium]
MSMPKDCRYTKEHEWARPEGDGIIVVGVTEYAAEKLGDIVYVELPKEGDEVTKDETFGFVESTKSVSDLFAPASGTVVEVNEALVDSPEIVNEDPWDEGWFIKVEMSDPRELNKLMSAAEYEEYIGELD